MKILQINASYKPAYIYGGPTMSVSMLSEQLAKAGIQTEVFTTTANGDDELPVLSNQAINVDGVNVRYFKRVTKDHSHFSPRLLTALWREAGNYDAVHIHAWWNLVSVLSCAIALTRKVPVVISPRGTLSLYTFNTKSSVKKKMMQILGGKRLLNKCHIHVTSRAEKKTIAGILKPKSVTCIANFVKLPARAPSEKRVSEGFLKLLFFSRIEEKKGLDILLQALPSLTIPFSLTIAGDGDKTYIENLKKLLPDEVKDKVSWIGFQNENKFEIFYEHDLLVLPSYNENFGNVVIESLCVGTAVLLSEFVGLADYIKWNDLGWVCPVNPKSVSDAIIAISQNKDELEMIRKVAPAIISEDFNPGSLVQKYLDMYREIIRASRSFPRAKPR